jgi:WD40 repeat protein
MAHSDTISSVKFGFDNCTLVSASNDGSVALWKVVRGALASDEL